MIRFIFLNKFRCPQTGLETESFHTVDLDVPEIEKRLSGGGSGESGYDYTRLMGVELLPASVQAEPPAMPVDYDFAPGACTISGKLQMNTENIVSDSAQSFTNVFHGKVAENSGDSVETKLFKGEELR